MFHIFLQFPCRAIIAAPFHAEVYVPTRGAIVAKDGFDFKAGPVIGNARLMLEVLPQTEASAVVEDPQQAIDVGPIPLFI
jgi:hypothetical protein